MTYKPYSLEQLKAELHRDEGYRDKPYLDSVGKMTIGVGHNLDDRGQSPEIIEAQLLEDIDQAEKDLDGIDPVWRTLNANRQRVLLNMAFNLGKTRLEQFRNMWATIRDGRLVEVPRHMLDSKWAKQVGKRANRLAELWDTV